MFLLSLVANLELNPSPSFWQLCVLTVPLLWNFERNPGWGLHTGTCFSLYLGKF